MRKLMIAVVLCLAMLGVLAGPVLAQGAGLGAVKLPLFEREPGYDPDTPGVGDQAGWAVANTNADGKLIVETHLDKGEPDTTFFVFVKINLEWFWVDVGELTTNRQGKGNAHLELDIADYPSSTSTIEVQVVVRVGPPYLPGYASAYTLVPLKN